MTETKNAPALSIVVPVRDEADRIGHTLRRIAAYMAHREPISWEALIVDDDSADDTRMKVLAFALTNPNFILLPNPGRLGLGYAVRQGATLARGRRIGVIGSDPGGPIETIERMEEALLDGYDLAVVTGRGQRLGPRRATRMRREIPRSLIRPLLPDSDSGFPLCMMFQRTAAQEIFRRQRIVGRSFVVEVLYLANRYRYSVFEIGSENPGSPAIAPSVGDLVKIRMHRLRGDYG